MPNEAAVNVDQARTIRVRIDKWAVNGTFLFFNPPKDGSPLKFDFGFIAFIKCFSSAQLREN